MMAYFIGLAWWVIVEIEYNEQEIFADSTGQNFIKRYKLYERTNYEIAVTAVYFTFTILSTVGLGDYVPQSNYERLLGSALLFFGVMLSSFMKSNFLEMLTNWNEINKEMDDEINM